MSDIEATALWARSAEGRHALARDCKCRSCIRDAWLEAWAAIGWCAYADLRIELLVAGTVTLMRNVQKALGAQQTEIDNMNVVVEWLRKTARKT